MIHIITQFEMFFFKNFCQTYTPCRDHSIKCSNGNIRFLEQKVIRVQSQYFSKYLSVTHFFSCSQIRESSQQPKLQYHFVFKINFEEGFLPPKFFLSVALSEAFILHSSLIRSKDHFLDICQCVFKDTLTDI